MHWDPTSGSRERRASRPHGALGSLSLGSSATVPGGAIGAGASQTSQWWVA